MVVPLNVDIFVFNLNLTILIYKYKYRLYDITITIISIINPTVSTKMCFIIWHIIPFILIVHAASHR